MNLKNWIESGAPFIWLNAGAVSISILMVASLIAFISVKGLSHFWPSDVMTFMYEELDGTNQLLAGELVDHEETDVSSLMDEDHRLPETLEWVNRYLVKTGNRDILGLDFRWVLEPAMRNIERPVDLIVVERREWGNFYGYLNEVKNPGIEINQDMSQWEIFQELIESSSRIFNEIRHIEKDLIGRINYQMEMLRLEERRIELEEIIDLNEQERINSQRNELQVEYNGLTEQLTVLYEQFNAPGIQVELVDGRQVEIPLSKVVKAYRPNSMSTWDKLIFYFKKLWEFVSDDPREANTEGGIFPAVFGTILMVLIMAVIVTPFGVIAAIYLHEYAKQGPLTRLIRIAVNNLAGVPSVVYGVFGLGFFVYFLGGSIDELLFPEALPTPTFGTPGLMWASLTLAILTVPVVIVATEEGLSRVPRAIREGSLALGATKAETLWRTVMPMTAPAIMTGLILAIARAAGEVAPLMLVGVVKLAPSLPLDGNFPYLHLERKFMHLGFHIYDVGFQSPNVEAARPLVYATALLLILIIIVLNLTAIKIRNNLREKFRAAEQH